MQPLGRTLLWSISTLVVLVLARKENTQDDEWPLKTGCGRFWHFPLWPGSERLELLNGEQNFPYQFPILVRIYLDYLYTMRNGTQGRRQSVLSGVIVGKSHVLTANSGYPKVEYCSGFTNVTFLRRTINSVGSTKYPGLSYPVEKYQPHPDYICQVYDGSNPRLYHIKNDLALLQIKGQFVKFKVNRRGGVNRVCLPSGETRYPLGDLPAFFTGFGGDQLGFNARHIRTSFVNRNECQYRYNQKPQFPISQIEPNIVCYGSAPGANVTKLCRGDVGGPLVRLLDNRWELVGIMSHNILDTLCEAKLIAFAEVASQFSWIKSIVPDADTLSVANPRTLT